MTILVFSKRMYRAPRNRAYQKSLRVPLCSALICLLAVLAFSALYGPPAWAQKTAVAIPPVISTGPTIVDQYIADGYSVHGPQALESVSAQALVFPGLTGQKGLEISLVNKAVVVLDAAGNASRFSGLRSGVSVRVCHRKDRVVIYLVSNTKGRSRYAY
jgi:hypothetical protein